MNKVYISQIAMVCGTIGKEIFIKVEALMNDYRKRKWNIWIWLLAIKPLVDIVMIFFISDRVSVSQDYDSLSSFMGVSILMSVVLVIIAFVGTIITITKIFGDRHFELKYRFWTMGIIAIVTAIFNIVAGVVYDMAEYGIVEAKAAQNGEELLGHGAPAFTIGFVLVSILYVAIAVIAGIVVQVIYSGKRRNNGK